MARIVTNVSANTVYKNYSRNNDALAASMERMATGLRINRAADDPAGLAISETLRGNIKATDAAVDIIANANNFINTADGYLQTVHDIMGRMEELALKAGDGTLSTLDKSNVAVEFNKLRDEISTIGSNAKFNGLQIFTSSAKTFTVDASGTQFSVQLSSLGDLSISSMAEDGTLTTGTTQLSLVQAGITSISTMRAGMGASQSRLQFMSLSQQNLSENMGAAEGRIRNVDVAKEATQLSKYQILVQSGTAMLAQANSAPQNILSLLR